MSERLVAALGTSLSRLVGGVLPGRSALTGQRLYGDYESLSQCADDHRRANDGAIPVSFVLDDKGGD